MQGATTTAQRFESAEIVGRYRGWDLACWSD